MLTWYIPSFHGDIKLEAVSAKETKVHAFSMTDEEILAMELLRSHALKGRLFTTPWSTPEEFGPVRESVVRTEQGMRVVLRAPIEKVAKLLSTALKPDRRLLTVVRFESGKIAELKEADAREEEPAVPSAAVAAATVARPDRGCPIPEFVKADIRATRVLETFLDPDQLSDFRARNEFVTVGQDSGHRYIVRSRNSPTIDAIGGRSLYDLDMKAPVCVHDWSVPAAEEMLTLHLFLSLPGWESWMLTLPHD